MPGEFHAEQMAPAQAPDGGAIKWQGTGRHPVLRDSIDARALLGADRAGPLPIVSKGGRLIGVLALEELLVRIDQQMDHLISALSRELQRCKMTTPD